MCYREIMNKMTQDLYDRYKDQVDWDGINLSVECEMYCALFSKAINHTQASLKEGTRPPHFVARMNARIDALIAVSVELTALGLTLMLRENQ